MATEKRSSVRDVKCGVLPVQSALLRDGLLTCRIYLQPAHRQTSCLIYTSRFLNSELFGWVYKPFVTIWTMQLALMSDNTSAVAYLRYQGGGGRSHQMSDLAVDICRRGWKSGNTLVPRHIPGHLNVLVDHLSRKYQILKTEWSLDQTIVDRVFHLWGKPHVDLFALERNVKLATCMSPEPMSWKVDSLVQSWRNPYAYVYPPTSLIRACLNKSGQRT